MSIEEALTEQPIPEDASCPECGGEPLPQRVTHQLSAIGYTHDDQLHLCEDCGHQWTCGVPIGEFDRPEMVDDLLCDSCSTWMLPHRGAEGGGAIVFHMKCPNCFYFDTIRREKDNNRVALLGYPQISGETAGCKPYGYSTDEIE